MKRYLSVFALLLFFHSSFSQDVLPPKNEFRAVWISTVVNLDWPSSPSTEALALLTEFTDLLDKHKANGINAVFVQVRPASDAIYKSSIEPWSEWITGKQGKPLEGKIDLLKVMIDEAHKRNMEFHAWFNPYRAVHNSKKSSISEEHVSVKHPEWIIEYDKGKFLNPGLPDVRKYIQKVVLDVVKRYDIDGVHFDDYFYPYPIKGAVIHDEQTYQQYGKDYDNLGDWRRANVNLLIRSIYVNIMDVKPHVKFGISPFGVWRNSDVDPRGSETKAGIPSYDSIYADTRLWLEEAIIDYVTPQLYWSIGFKPADFKVLVPWWANNTFGRHLYVGHSPYKVGDNFDKNWYDSTQIPNQIRLVRSMPGKVHGSAFFSSKSLLKNSLGVVDSLRQFYAYPALTPSMPWKDNVAPKAPGKIKITDKNGKYSLDWKTPKKASDGDLPHRYILYKVPNGTKFNQNDPRFIAAIIPASKSKKVQFVDKSTQKQGYTLYISSLDRLNNESEATSIELK